MLLAAEVIFSTLTGSATLAIAILTEGLPLHRGAYEKIASVITYAIFFGKTMLNVLPLSISDTTSIFP